MTVRDNLVAAHTPKPWTLIEIEGKLCPVGPGNLSVLTIVEEDGTKFAAVYDPDDARLIAAAPDLLELAYLVRNSFGGGPVITFSDDDIEQFETAIAKAEGRS